MSNLLLLSRNCFHACWMVKSFACARRSSGIISAKYRPVATRRTGPAMCMASQTSLTNTKCCRRATASGSSWRLCGVLASALLPTLPRLVASFARVLIPWRARYWAHWIFPPLFWLVWRCYALPHRVEALSVDGCCLCFPYLILSPEGKGLASWKLARRKPMTLVSLDPV